MDIKKILKDFYNRHSDLDDRIYINVVFITNYTVTKSGFT